MTIQIKGKTLTEQQLKVNQKLTEWFNEFSAFYTGEGSQDNWKFDGWKITITGPNKKKQTFDYKAGLGNRNLSAIDKQNLKSYGFRYGTIAYKNYIRTANWVIYKPCAADALFCLLLDADSGLRTFSEFCNEFGYASDSIKAFKTYQACQETTDNIKSLFNSKQIEELKELLQDY